MSQNSDILVVGKNPPQFDFIADTSDSFAQAESYLNDYHPRVVVVLDSDSPERLNEFLLNVERLSPQSLWVVAQKNLSASELLALSNHTSLHAWIDNSLDPELTASVRSALEASGEEVQRRQLLTLFSEQSEQLKKLLSELESSKKKRQRTLKKSRSTLEQTKSKLEAFHKALIGIHRASTLLQMEQNLMDALSEIVQTVRIRFASQSLIKQSMKQLAPSVLVIDLPLEKNQPRGEILFTKIGNQPFTKGEEEFFYELSDALLLAVQRLQTLEQAEILKTQWQATFDSIPHPLCLTNQKLEIIKLNRAFQQSCGSKSFKSLIGKNCFEIFFGKDFKTIELSEDEAFTFRQARTGRRETEHFEVNSEPLRLNSDEPGTRLVLIRSITDEVRFERRIFEGSKLAELGTIGSSIAHELNNPLGGMLSFLQLIMMDLKKDSPFYPDIKSMEQAVLRCRDIVQNLLSFARKQDLGDFVQSDFNDVLEKSVKLIELQSKSKGIRIDFTRFAPYHIYASPNALSQAICNLLQNSIDAISEKLKEDSLFPGEIRLRVDTKDNKYTLRLSDNGAGIRPEVQSQIFNPLFTTRDPGLYSGMGLTTAFTIIAEHQGNLEILSQTGSGTTAIVSLPRLDVTPESPIF